MVDDVSYLEADGSAPDVPKGWAAAQAAASADFSHGSFFWTHISGGLNYQVLFRGFCQRRQPPLFSVPSCC